MKNFITLFCAICAALPVAALDGTVVDEYGESVIGAAARVTGRQGVAALTDADGRFSLPAAVEGDTVEVSYVGMQPAMLVVAPGMTTCRVTLHASRSQLDEVVVVGYATQRKIDLTGSVAQISSAALADRPLTDATAALAGLAPGLSVVNTGGSTPGYESQTITVRGRGTLNDAAPLVVVDGATGIALSDLNPRDIESITVLKDAASAAIYGSGAAHGGRPSPSRRAKSTNGATMPGAIPPSIPTPTGRTTSTATPPWCRPTT